MFAIASSLGHSVETYSSTFSIRLALTRVLVNTCSAAYPLCLNASCQHVPCNTDRMSVTISFNSSSIGSDVLGFLSMNDQNNIAKSALNLRKRWVLHGCHSHVLDAGKEQIRIRILFAVLNTKWCVCMGLASNIITICILGSILHTAARSKSHNLQKKTWSIQHDLLRTKKTFAGKGGAMCCMSCTLKMCTFVTIN